MFHSSYEYIITDVANGAAHNWKHKNLHGASQAKRIGTAATVPFEGAGAAAPCARRN